MWAAGSPLEERVYSRRATWRSRRRARGDGVFVRGGVALPCLCGGSRRRVSSRKRESDAVVFSLRLCKKGRVCRRIHRHGGYYYVIAPGSGRGRARPQLLSSPLQVVNVKAALFRRVPGIFHCPAALEPHRSLAAVRVVPWYHWMGGREFWYRKWPPEIRSCSGCSERSSSKLCYHVGACLPASPATETKQPWRHWVQLA